MALVVVQDFKIGIGGNDEGITMSLTEHDIPGLENSQVLIALEKDVAEKIWEQMGERLGKGTPKIEVVGAHHMPGGEHSGITD